MDRHSKESVYITLCLFAILIVLRICCIRSDRSDFFVCLINMFSLFVVIVQTNKSVSDYYKKQDDNSIIKQEKGRFNLFKKVEYIAFVGLAIIYIIANFVCIKYFHFVVASSIVNDCISIFIVGVSLENDNLINLFIDILKKDNSF